MSRNKAMRRVKGKMAAHKRGGAMRVPRKRGGRGY